MCGDCKCCLLPCMLCRVLGYLCLNKCARIRRTDAVCGSLIKKSELPEIFNQFDQSHKSTSIHNISCRVLSEVGNLAILAAVHVDWDDDSSDEYVLKTIAYDRTKLLLAMHPRRKVVAPIMRQFLTGCHNSECSAYELLRHHSDVKVPKIYFTRYATETYPGIIIMENLSDRAKSESIWRGLDLQQVLSVVEMLARIHIVSLKDQSWRTGVADDVRAGYNFLVVFDLMTTFFSNLKSAPGDLAKLDVKKVQHFCTSEKYFELVNCHRGKLPDVIVHSDLLINNIMFERLPDGKPGSQLAAIIDWQLARAGNPLDDISKLLGWTAQLEVFEHHRDTVLQRYYDIVRAEAPEQFDITYDDMREVFLDTLAAHCLVVPVVVSFYYKFPQRTEFKSTMQQKVDNIRKAVLAFEFASERLLSMA